MDYLDRNKQLRQHVLLYVGYVLIAIAITIAALILVHQAYGFGIGKNGTVIQNGLIFFSSQPNPADIYIDNQLRSEKTNTRMVLPAGIYDVKLARDGYRDWQRTIELEGGTVEHFDYPFLFPKELDTEKVQSYSAQPGFLTQSPDRRWLLVQQPGEISAFTLYDLKNPEEPVATPLSLPVDLVAKASGQQSWSLAEWADNNRHVLLQHTYDGKTEYVIVDRQEPAQSQNLTVLLGLSSQSVTLRDKKYDLYYVFDQPGAKLSTVSLEDTVLKPRLERVLAYKSYGSDTLLYVTDQDAEKDKALVMLIRGDNRAVAVRSLPANTSYLVDIAKYSGTTYVAAGATGSNKVYIYKDPEGQVAKRSGQSPAPAQVLHVTRPSYLSFSNSAQFILAEGGDHFGVYDIENQLGYNYTATLPIDAPQVHANWMDGNRLVYVSGGKLAAIDYDNANAQTLMPAVSGLPVAFSPDYKYVYSIGQTGVGFDLNRTALVTPADQ